MGDQPKYFDQEYIRVCKVLGGSLYDSEVFNGIIIQRPPLTKKLRVEKAKVCVFACPFVMDEGETKTTLQIKNATDLLNFTKSEEDHMERLVKGIADQGVNVIVIGGSISELANHYFKKYGLMCIKSMSKFEVKRLCKSIGDLGLPKLGVPTQEELGYCDLVHVKEIGSEKVTIFEKESQEARLTTIVLRGATTTLLDDVERAIDDGINTFRVMLKSPRFLLGAGATEAYLSNKLESEGSKISTLEQYSFCKYAESFQVILQTLLDNAGLDKNRETNTILSANNEDIAKGVDVLNSKLSPVDEMSVYDHLDSKKWAIQLASDAAITVLKVDQIIIAKPAGGPKPRGQQGWDNDDDHC
jgi:T-complex protein 1 subunit theta